MDYNKVSTANIDGNGNLLLQDVEGENITINYNDTKEFAKLLAHAGDKLTAELKSLISDKQAENKVFAEMLMRYLDLPPEIKQLKNQLKNEIQNIRAELDAKAPPENTEDEKKATRPSRRESSLMRALREKKCILFLGPEISVNEAGKSLHDQFYLSLTNDPESDLEYNAGEGFFQPHHDPWFASDVQNYYENEFPAENNFGNKVLESLAGLPFKLIVSMAPDDSLHRLYEKYDLPHEYLFYDKSKLPEIKPETAKPVIFNMLGSPVKCESDWKYIFTYADLFNYLQSANIPGTIKNEIKNAVHYLFIGFDFNKWHNRLILYVLDIIEGKDSKIRQLVEPEKIETQNLDFLKKQFNISVAENDYLTFVQKLAEQAQTAGIGKNLETAFAQKQLADLDQLADRLFDTDKMTELKNIEVEINTIKQKIV
jgi:hypothetical protein